MENLGALVSELSFTPDGSRLLTDSGAVTMPNLPFASLAATPASAAPAAPEERSGHRHGYGFSRDQT